MRQNWLKTFILLGMALYFIILIMTGSLANYINLRFAWLSYVGAAIFLLLGGWSLYTLRRQSMLRQYHTPLSWGALALVAIPLVFAALIPAQPLSIDAISGGVSLQPIGGVRAEASFSVPPSERNVLDWLREFNRVSNPAELDGLPVDVIAFVYREPAMQTGEFMAARFTMSCCVADAMAIGMPVYAADSEQFADGAWVRVQGTLQAGMFNGERVPIIQPTSIESVDPPENPYLYS